jgi:hypothetical protein
MGKLLGIGETSPAHLVATDGIDAVGPQRLGDARRRDLDHPTRALVRECPDLRGHACSLYRSCSLL